MNKIRKNFKYFCFIVSIFGAVAYLAGMIVSSVISYASGAWWLIALLSLIALIQLVASILADRNYYLNISLPVENDATVKKKKEGNKKFYKKKIFWIVLSMYVLALFGACYFDYQSLSLLMKNIGLSSVGIGVLIGVYCALYIANEFNYHLFDAKKYADKDTAEPPLFLSMTLGLLFCLAQDVLFVLSLSNDYQLNAGYAILIGVVIGLLALFHNLLTHYHCFSEKSFSQEGSGITAWVNRTIHKHRKAFIATALSVEILYGLSVGAFAFLQIQAILTAANLPVEVTIVLSVIYAIFYGLWMTNYAIHSLNEIDTAISVPKSNESSEISSDLRRSEECTNQHSILSNISSLSKHLPRKDNREISTGG